VRQLRAWLPLAVLFALTAGAIASLARRDDLSRAHPYRTAAAHAPLAPPYLMFRTLAPAAAHDRVAMVAVGKGDRASTRVVTPLTCTRVHFGGGRGVCLIEETDGRATSHSAIVFDDRFRRLHRLALPGVPTRVRVASDGRLAAVSTYAEEESPEGERLALETVIIDTERGAVLADLREFAVDGQAETIATPRDFSSVSFADDGDHFYATVSTPAMRHLVMGSVRERRLRVVAAGVASEGLSPDGQRLIVKRVSDRGFWQLSVLDVASMAERRLDHGTRSIDDQVDWLDDRTVIFHDATGTSTGIWRLSVDGQAGPELLVADAYSPVAVRR
jgi:hypothetical protein